MSDEPDGKPFGATPEEWAHFDLVLGLGEDLLPAVANPNAVISPNSKLKALGKTPSVYNGQGHAVGLPGWTKIIANGELKVWPRNPDYALCIQTRRWRGLDLDVSNLALSATIAAAIDEYLGVILPARRRANSGKQLLAVIVEGDIPKRRMTVEGGVIELLGNGNHFVAAGTHPSGARYQWAGGLPDEPPTITLEQLNGLWTYLTERFAVEPPVEAKASERQRGEHLDLPDPVADFIEANGLSLGDQNDGSIMVQCPWDHEHSGGTPGDGSTVWFRAGSNGHDRGHFKCLHAHCEGRTDGDFFAAIDYAEDVAAQFEDLGPDIEAEAKKAASKIRVVSFLDLMEDTTPNEPDYIEPDFLGHGNFCLIAGPPKAQKSFLLQEMLMACVTGGTFLAGTFRVPRPLRVFYVQAEMNRKLLRKRARMVEGLVQPEQRDLIRNNFVVTERFHMLLNPEGVKETIRTIREAFPDRPPDIIALDPLANLFDGESEDKAREVMQFLTQRVEAIRRAINPAAAVVLVHHAAKRSSEDLNRDPFVAIRGSGALRGYYDTGIVVFRKSDEAPERRVFFELRSGESPEPMTVRLSAFGVFEKVDTSVEGIGDDVAAKMLAELKRRWDARNPLSLVGQTRTSGRHAPTVFASSFGVKAEAVEKLIGRWFASGRVVQDEYDKRNSRFGIRVIEETLDV